MPDREKVMKGLECCIVRDPDAKRNCVECPYNHEGIITNAPCANGLMADALALLKEQEAVEPKLYTPESKTIWSNWHICGACEHPVDPGDKFCRECGRPIKWEENSDASR